MLVSLVVADVLANSINNFLSIPVVAEQLKRNYRV